MHKKVNFQTKCWFLLATAGGVGFLPGAPGTYGSLVGLGVAYGLAVWGATDKLKIFFWFFLFFSGVFAAHRFDQWHGTKDHSQVVIDEVVGMGIASFWLEISHSKWLWLMSFLLFRLFDIVKRGPVGWVDRFSKTKTFHFGGTGWGVMWDDVVAGGMAYCVLENFQRVRLFFEKG